MFSLCDFIAGWTGGVLGLIVGHPLDTIKVRQQVLPAGSSSLAIAKSTFKVEGILGFFKGMSFPLFGSGVYNALFFGVYGNCLRCLQGVSGPNVRKMCCEGAPPSPTWHRDVFLAGCAGGTAAVLYSCPLEIIKIKLQAQTTAFPTKTVSVCKNVCKTEPMYCGPYDAMKKIYKNYGIYHGLYKGTWSMLWRDVPTFGLYTLSYEHILCWFKKKEDRSHHTTVTSQIVAGGIAGVLSWVTVAPLDVIKSRIQADDFGRPIYRGMMDCLRKTIHQDGVKALFLGIVLATVRSFPVNAATFVGYEFVNKITIERFFLANFPANVTFSYLTAVRFQRSPIRVSIGNRFNVSTAYDGAYTPLKLNLFTWDLSIIYSDSFNECQVIKNTAFRRFYGVLTSLIYKTMCWRSKNE